MNGKTFQIEFSRDDASYKIFDANSDFYPATLSNLTIEGQEMVVIGNFYQK
jgi:hypothetical protein